MSFIETWKTQDELHLLETWLTAGKIGLVHKYAAAVPLRYDWSGLDRARIIAYLDLACGVTRCSLPPKNRRPMQLNHPVPHASQLAGSSHLHVLTMISNPVRYRSRYALLEQFREQNDPARRIGDRNVTLWTIEIAYGHRPFAVTERDNPHHIQLRTPDELWHKENALNVGIAHACQAAPDAEYFAWVDADITFTRADWAAETLHQLQHYDVVQMFSHAQDVGPKHEPIGFIKNSFAWMYYNEPRPTPASGPATMRTADGYYGYSAGGYWHPGFAWAARRSALDQLGGLIDVCIVGSADWHMAAALIGQVEQTLSSALHANYRAEVLRWQSRAERAIGRNIGYVDGMINHQWHGKKADRGYQDRWRIPVDNAFDPAEDLIRDAQGLYRLTPNKPRLRDDLRTYFRSRNEDSIDA